MSGAIIINSSGHELHVTNSIEELREHLRAGGIFEVRLKDGGRAGVNAAHVAILREDPNAPSLEA